MSLNIQALKVDFEIIVSKVANYLNKFLTFLVNLSIIIGLLGTIILISNPTIDDDISRSVIQALIDRYQSLDTNQKIQIKMIFSEIFLEK